MKQAASKLLCMVLAVLVLAGIMAPAAEAAGSAAIWFDNGISVPATMSIPESITNPVIHRSGGVLWEP